MRTLYQNRALETRIKLRDQPGWILSFLYRFVGDGANGIGELTSLAWFLAITLSTSSQNDLTDNNIEMAYLAFLDPAVIARQANARA
jgi:hypothetical protein